MGSSGEWDLLGQAQEEIWCVKEKKKKTGETVWEKGEIGKSDTCKREMKGYKWKEEVWKGKEMIEKRFLFFSPRKVKQAVYKMKLSKLKWWKASGHSNLTLNFWGHWEKEDSRMAESNNSLPWAWLHRQEEKADMDYNKVQSAHRSTDVLTCSNSLIKTE